MTRLTRQIREAHKTGLLDQKEQLFTLRGGSLYVRDFLSYLSSLD